MAAAPEGDCWFHHDALRSKHFNPEDPKQFYSTIWLEVASNSSWDEECQKCPPIPWERHPRAGKHEIPGPILTTWYSRHKFMTAMVGSSNKNISRYKKVHGTYGRNDLEHQSGKRMVVFFPVDMPTPDERYLWVDLTFPLRGIYFPKRVIAQPKYPKQCMYSRIKVTARPVTLKTFANPREPPMGTYEIKKICDKEVGPITDLPTKRRYHARWEELEKSAKPPLTLPDEKLQEGSLAITPDEWLGWGVWPEWTARFDVKHIMHILTLPRDWLKEEYKDPYDHITLYDCRYLDLIGNESYTMNSNDHGVDLTTVTRKEYGVAMDYKGSGFDRFWVTKTIGGLILVGVSLIPGYGPLAAFGGQLLLDYFTDPDVFTAERFSSDRVPVAGAAGYAEVDQIRGLLKKSAENAKEYIDPNLINKIVRLAGKRH